MSAAKKATPRRRWRTRTPPQQGRLYRADDNGPGVELDPAAFGGNSEEGWGRAYESFRRLNEEAFAALGVAPRFESTTRGPVLTLCPGGRVGAIPLRSGTSGHVVAGYVVRPRFGWSGVGSILSETGWHSAPNILPMPLVPGSGREVPPWVLAGPVIARLRALLEQLKRGFDFKEDTPQAPRGTIQWSRYLRTSLPSGRWHHVPCRFPICRRTLSSEAPSGGPSSGCWRNSGSSPVDDRVALGLRTDATRLLEQLGDVARVYPRVELIGRMSGGDPLLAQTVRSGLEAIGWVRDERGLGGGRQMDGLAWSLPLDRLWEDHVAAKVQEHVRQEGGVLRLGRRGETVTPLHWSDPSHRSMGHLVPDIVVSRPGLCGSLMRSTSPTSPRLTKAAGASWRTRSGRVTGRTFIKSLRTVRCSTHRKLRRRSHTRSGTRTWEFCTSEAWTGRSPTSTTELDTCGWSCGGCRSVVRREGATQAVASCRLPL